MIDKEDIVIEITDAQNYIKEFEFIFKESSFNNINKNMTNEIENNTVEKNIIDNTKEIINKNENEDGKITKQDLMNLESIVTASIGELTEAVKKITSAIEKIPEILDRLKKLESSTENDITSIKGNVLINEEEINKIWATINQKDGKEKLVREQIKTINTQIEKLEQKEENTTKFKAFEINRNDLNKRIDEIKRMQDKLQKPKNGKSSEKNVENENTSRIKETYKDAVFDHDIILLTDSNGKQIIADKLADGVKCKRYLCYTYDDVLELLNQVAVIKHPKKILLNIGTNDVEYADGNTSELVKHIEEIIQRLKKMFPTTRVYFSSIFPRKGENLSKVIEELNIYLECVCDKTPLLTYMDNNQINKNHLSDEKHLNKHGLYIFLCNIRFYLFGQFQQVKKKDTLQKIPTK